MPKSNVSVAEIFPTAVDFIATKSGRYFPGKENNDRNNIRSINSFASLHRVTDTNQHY